MAPYGLLWPTVALYQPHQYLLSSVQAVNLHIIPLWPYMAISGPIWPYTAIYGNIWPNMAQYGPIWPNMALYGPIWPYVALYGPI